jgi:hypothetical protein
MGSVARRALSQKIFLAGVPGGGFFDHENWSEYHKASARHVQPISFADSE